MDLIPCTSGHSGLHDVRKLRCPICLHIDIYHERQGMDGSMMCAQHCLNNLLQQKVYSEVDLAEMATVLDTEENARLSSLNQRATSQNMDDTGFFSLGVLERALEVFGLDLVRLGSEKAKSARKHPENESAFVLNLESHWIPLRRFAGSPSRWYDLDSFATQPSWVSSMFLAMKLQQAEREGYSVFIIRKSAASGFGAGERAIGAEAGALDATLPECEADLAAITLGEPVDRQGASAFGAGSSAAATPRAKEEPPKTTAKPAAAPSISVPPAVKEDAPAKSQRDGSLAPPPAAGSSRPMASSSSSLKPQDTIMKPSKRREKVALEPGHSPLDWARITANGGDPSVMKGKAAERFPMRVTMEELKKHKTPEDAWSAYNGKVYNITPYLKFHPGGEKELMRSAGRDGTKLFMNTHAWVNVDHMLDACLVGMLVT